MANVADVYPPELWAEEALILLEANKVVANLVHRDFEPVIARRGDVIHTRSRSLLSVQSVSNPPSSPLTFADPQATDILVQLRYHEATAFKLSERDMQTSIDTLVEDYVEPAIIPISQSLDTRLMSGDLAGFPADGHGLFDETLTASTDVATGGSLVLADFANLWGGYVGQNAPVQPSRMRMLMGTAHATSARAVENLVDTNRSGLNPPPSATGLLGQIMGFDTFFGQNVPLDVPSGTTVASQPQTAAFHRNALTLVTRPLEPPPRDLGVRGAIVQKDGLGIRVVMSYDHGLLSWLTSYDLLWGFRLLDGNLVHRLVG